MAGALDGPTLEGMPVPDIMPHEPSPDHADQAASHVLALVAASDPAYRVTPERHDTMVDLIHAVVRAVSGGAR